MGSFVANMNDLKSVLKAFTKDVHHLKETDLDGSDKMNYAAVLAISNKRMETILDQVPGSDGTKVYLRIMRYVLQSYTDETISTDQRIYLIWYAVFFLRLWKRWILGSSYRLENFIAANAYMCIELNAHSLKTL